MGNRKNILQLHDCNNRQPKFMYYLRKSLAPPREINQIQLKSDRERTQGTLRWRGESDLIHQKSRLLGKGLGMLLPHIACSWIKVGRRAGSAQMLHHRRSSCGAEGRAMG